MALIALDDEIARRYALRTELQSISTDFLIQPGVLHDLVIKSGQRGVYRDSHRTDHVVEGGIAVSLHHTGRDYGEDLGEDGIFYHYPSTQRDGQDRADILAIENAFRLRVPLFVIEDRPGSLRRVHWGWVQYIDEHLRGCFVAFSRDPPHEFKDLATGSDEIWSGIGARTTKLTTSARTLRDARFKFLVRSRYGDRCAATGIRVAEMLEAAHVVEVQDGGKDQAINGILLEAGVHRAFDVYLWTIEPKTLRLVTRKSGPTLRDMGIPIDGLSTESVLPASEAIEIRWTKFERIDAGT